MRRLGYALGVAVLGLVPCSSMAQSDADIDISKGNGFLRICSAAAPGTFMSGACLGYFRGFIDRDDLESKIVDDEGQPSAEGHRWICAPSSSTYGQAHDIVLAYLRKHPEQRHLRTNSLVQSALWEAFPCPSKPEP